MVSFIYYISEDIYVVTLSINIQHSNIGALCMLIGPISLKTHTSSVMTICHVNYFNDGCGEVWVDSNNYHFNQPLRWFKLIENNQPTVNEHFLLQFPNEQELRPVYVKTIVPYVANKTYDVRTHVYSKSVKEIIVKLGIDNINFITKQQIMYNVLSDNIPSMRIPSDPDFYELDDTSALSTYHRYRKTIEIISNVYTLPNNYLLLNDVRKCYQQCVRNNMLTGRTFEHPNNQEIVDYMFRQSLPKEDNNNPEYWLYDQLNHMVRSCIGDPSYMDSFICKLLATNTVITNNMLENLISPQSKLQPYRHCEVFNKLTNELPDMHKPRKVFTNHTGMVGNYVKSLVDYLRKLNNTHLCIRLHATRTLHVAYNSNRYYPECYPLAPIDYNLLKECLTLFAEDLMVAEGTMDSIHQIILIKSWTEEICIHLVTNNNNVYTTIINMAQFTLTDIIDNQLQWKQLHSQPI